MKKCSKCKQTKPFTEFNRYKATRDGYYSLCKKCHVANNSKNYYRKKEEDPFFLRRKHLKYTYNMTLDCYDSLLKKQEARCPICLTQFDVFDLQIHKKLIVDHDHQCCPGYKSCGICVRGLICHLCNKGLGQFKDSIEALERAIIYLRD